MRTIKYLFSLLLLFSIFTSCKKTSVKATKTTLLDTDALIHSIKLVAPAQFAATTVKNDTLTITYYENISLLIPTSGYTYSYALHLVEDFSATSLKNANYTTYDAYGDVTYDFVDDNLNDVSAKAVTDTTISGVAMKKITVQRPFIFKKGYLNAQAAIAAQDSTNAVTTDNMNFHAFVYFGKNYPASSAVANLYYLKGQ